MGCKLSTTDQLASVSQRWKILFHSIGLNDVDVSKFWKIYCKIKLQSKLDIIHPLPIRSVLSYLDVEPVIFMFKVFSAFKSNNEPNGTLDCFGEFLFSLWNFCTLDENLLGKCIASNGN